MTSVNESLNLANGKSIIIRVFLRLFLSTLNLLNGNSYFLVTDVKRAIELLEKLHRSE